MGEIIFVVLLAGGFLIPAWIFKQKWLFRVFLVFFVVFGLIEWWAVTATDMSVSQHFWALKDNNRGGALAVLIGMAVGWTALLWHFWFHKKKEK